MSGSIERMKAVAERVEASNIGYDQGQRWTYLDTKGKKINPNREADCSSLCFGIAWLAGYPVDITGTAYTGNFASKFKAAGFTCIRFASLSQIQAGDFIVGPGHVEFCYSKTRWFSARIDERGGASGGKAGDQTGRETSFTNAYYRSRGWTYILRPPQVDTSGRRKIYKLDGAKWPLLRQGSDHWRVKSLVVALNYFAASAGFAKLPVKSRFTPEVKAAVIAFQRWAKPQVIQSNGGLLEIDGVVGAYTWSAIKYLVP